MHLRRNFVGLIIVYVLTLLLGTQAVWRYQYNQLLTQHQNQLEQFSGHISAKLDKYAHLPQLIAQDIELIDALKNSGNSAQIDITNRYLENVNDVIQASDTYLLDVYGTTIAASNWNLDRSFLGRNFAWRPYFQDAIHGDASQYYALGSTSGQRGYYYSYPIRYAANVIGVIVVKMDLSAIEANWQGHDSYFVAADPNGIVFMSSRPDWLYASLQPIDPIKLKQIEFGRQYLDTQVRSLNLKGRLDQDHSELNSSLLPWYKGNFITSMKTLPNVELSIRVLTPKNKLAWSVMRYIIVVSLIFSIIYLLQLLTHHRKQKLRQFEQIQSEAKQKLEFLVLERTSELHAEIAERTKTEEALRQTQSELIQTAKLAILGEMSASISHELNNPLAAIRSFADNGRRFLASNKVERVDENLQRISGLTERMAKISEQLKSFARKSTTDDLSALSLSPIVTAAVDLIQPQLKSKQIRFSYSAPSETVTCVVNNIQLEQVVINLIQNAIQALEQQSERQVNVTLSSGRSQALIHIDDNGTGIKVEDTDKLFEPFYTTKKNGLGLGLSISAQIVHSMNGQLIVEQSPLGGARFTIALPIHAFPLDEDE